MLLENKHIFLVEDDPTNLAVIRIILKKHGASVPMVNWADTGLTRISSYPFAIDLFILDLMFPGKQTGYDVYDSLQANSNLKGIPAVIVSAADPDIEIPRARERGLQGFISKPVNRYRFPDQIKTILDGEKIWDDH
ncbi:MAG: response regulator [Chloroflexota bacterium]